MTELAELLARCAFPPAGTEVDCAVSGGADSLALLALAVAGGCRVTAIHVDHGLRAGSGAEASVVAAAASRFGAGFRAERVHLDPGPNLEARARSARRRVLPESALTGHTADDQAETVLLHLLRGAGADGLAAMGLHRHPLLALRRSETVALCADLGLEPVQDPSNLDPAHLRNRVRHELLPLLADVAGRDVVPILVRQAALLGEEARFLDELAAAVDVDGSRSLAAAPRPLARRAVRRWLTEGQEYPPDLATVERVLAVARHETRATDVGGGRRVSRHSGRLHLHGPVRSAVMASPPHPEIPDPHGLDVCVADPKIAGTRIADVKITDPRIGPVVVGRDQLAERVAALGKEITADYVTRGRLLLVGVLKGAFMFMSDLARAIDLPVEFDFMAVSSYGSATKTSGVVRIVKDLDVDLTGRHVLLVEDIVDSGLTLSYVRKNLKARGPASLETCALLVRKGLQKHDPGLRYVGFEIPPDFVIGYGLDAAEAYRNLSDVCVYAPGDEL